jgi:oligopeptide/dipeptide ABC transporter ATP-binding protein
MTRNLSFATPTPSPSPQGGGETRDRAVDTLPLLQVDGLVKHFVARRSLTGAPTAVVKAVNGVSFTVALGETLALVGESGCGKSTLGRLVLRLIEPTAGRVLFAGENISALGATELRAFRRHAQLVFQDPYASLNPRMTVSQMLTEVLGLHDVVPRGQRRARVADLLRLVGLDPRFARRYPHEFSGGQRQRIAIARALAAEPKLIVCDEPVSALDASIRSQVLNLLRELQQRLGLTYIFISHDLAVVKHIADRVAVMNFGVIMEIGRTDDLFASPRHPYTRALLSAIPVPSPRAKRERMLLQGDMPSALEPPSGCPFHTRCPFVIERCRSERPLLIADGAGHAAACHRVAELPPFASPLGDAGHSAALERLFSAFARSPDVREGGGVGTVAAGRNAEANTLRPD